MASSKPIPCGPCQEEKVNTKADISCYNCEEGLCSICSGHHKRSKASHDHNTIDIKSYKSIQAIKTECDKHGQQLNLYCPSHLMPCCEECISTSHSKCTGIKSLASLVEKTKIEKSKESLDKDIKSIIHLFDKMVNNKSINIKTGEQQCEDIKKSIVKIRNEINKHLDQLEKTLQQEADNLWDQEKAKAIEFITEIEGKKTNLQKMQDHLHSVATHSSSKLQSFLGVYHIEQQIHQCQRYVEDLENDDRARKFDIKITQNNEIEKTLKQIGSLEFLGEVMIVKTEIDKKRDTSTRRKAQVQSSEQSNINNMTMNIQTKKEINIKADITDMVCLVDGLVIEVERWGKVRILTSDGKLQKQLPIPGKAWSVTQINQNTIAITYTDEKAIKIFNMENETVTKFIKLDKPCYGLSFSNNSLAVGLSNNEIRIVDLEGNVLKSIQVQSESDLKYLVYCNDRVIYSDFFGKAVCCEDGSGKQIWQYKQDLSGPLGLCTDTYGNTIVADCDSGRIIVISKDGQDSKVLISEEDNLHQPGCLSFKHNESSGFICDFSGTYLAKFNLSSV